MSELDVSNWPGSNLEHNYPDVDGIVIATLTNPPDRAKYDSGAASIFARYARTTPGSMVPDWEMRDLTGTKDSMGLRESFLYVPMNSCARVEFDQPGYVGTGNLNGCTAVAAVYRDERDAVQVFEEHYDPETVREVDEQTGELKAASLLAAFAGQQAVRVAVAYSRVHNPTYSSWDCYRPEDFPVDAIIKQCQKLAMGSSVLLIPYETSSDFSNPKLGHMLYVGRGGSGLIDFGWNGHKVQVGEPEPFDAFRLDAARAHASSYEDDGYYSMDD